MRGSLFAISSFADVTGVSGATLRGSSDTEGEREASLSDEQNTENREEEETEESQDETSGEESSEETIQTAANFAQQIRKTAVRCGEVPGFVVNRILNSAVSEVWRVTEEEGLTVEEVDKVIKDSGTVPMGPFFLTDLLGLDTVLHVAEHLRESYGERFFVSARMKELVEAGDLGQKTGKGFYEHGS